MQVFRHRHEIENGCTSSISEHTIGITAEGRFCIAELGSDCLIREDDDDDDGEKMNSIHVATSKSSTDLKSLITFSDLAGHKKYFKITASGLASQFPDYAMLVVDGAKGVQPMTVEHLRIAIALEVAVFVVITKTDSTPAERIADTVKSTDSTPAERIADTVKSVEVLFDSVAPEKTIDKGVVPVMFVSSVSGHGIGLLQDYLAALSPKRNWMTKSSTGAEFQINKAYDFDDDGTIVTGLVQHGTISVGESLLLGPDSNGTFCKVTVDSIELSSSCWMYMSRIMTTAGSRRSRALTPTLSLSLLLLLAGAAVLSHAHEPRSRVVEVEVTAESEARAARPALFVC
ncbi:hypothetical protein ATCC90586_007953 [Pythium insidiosum]|nr:hypothetical protein ATCC90586_007953 [Pythium insidiosum]